MRRREFISLLGGATAAWSLVARAQQPAAPVIGLLHSASEDYFAPFNGPFHAGLKEAGFVERANVTIEYRWAEGHYDRLPSLVADLLGRKVEVLFAAGGTGPAKAAEVATTTTPIVFVSAADPVKTGLIASLSRPGGNVTGVYMMASELNGKKLGLMRTLVPDASVFATLINPNYSEAKVQADDFTAAAHGLGVRSAVLSAGTDIEIGNVFATVEQRHIGAIVLANDPFFGARRDRLVALAALHKVPMMYFQTESVSAGGLVTYGPDYADCYREGGVYVGRILKGEKPADMPVVQPTKFELMINLKTAKALGIAVPPNLLALADEVIE